MIRIKTIPLNEEHWTTQWIPISYSKILSNYKIRKSLSFIWSINNELNAICRSYYINDNIIEIGDVWLNDKYRGKKINGEKISIIFMKRVIKKIWKHYTNVKIINLIVDENNISAVKLYESLNFTFNKKLNNNKLGVKNAILMSLIKPIR